MWRLDKWVEWIEAGLELATQVENKTAMELRGFKRNLKAAKEVHDDMLLKYGINSLQTKTEHFSRAPDSQPAAPLFTSIYPYGQAHYMFSRIFQIRTYNFFKCDELALALLRIQILPPSSFSNETKS